METPFGLVLAGGQARRMGGGDKPLVPLAGRPMLAWILDRLAPQCRSILISSQGDARRWRSFPCAVLADPPDVAAAGPLAGILAGLDHLERAGHSDAWMLSVPGDVPFLPSDLAVRLSAQRARSDADVVCAETGGRTHPVVALWPVRLRTQLEDALRCGVRSVAAFQAGVRTVPLAWDTTPLDPFFNVNTRDDLVRAETICARQSRSS